MARQSFVYKQDRGVTAVMLKSSWQRVFEGNYIDKRYDTIDWAAAREDGHIVFAFLNAQRADWPFVGKEKDFDALAKQFNRFEFEVVDHALIVPFSHTRSFMTHESEYPECVLDRSSLASAFAEHFGDEVWTANVGRGGRWYE